MKSMKYGFALTFILVIVLTFFLFQSTDQMKRNQNQGDRSRQNAALVFYCAAGIKPPVERIAKAYEEEYGIPVQLQYGGSGTLLSNLAVSRRGDLYLAGDQSYIQIALEKNLLAESIPLAYMTPVIAVQKGNPKNMQSLRDLLREDVKVAMGSPDAASIGRTVQQLLTKSGDWDTLKEQITVFKPTVNEVANDIKIGAVDAGIVWDALAKQYPELDMIHIPQLDVGKEQITIGVLKSAAHPAASLRFARYLAARDKGLPEFEKFGYEIVDGDAWAETPNVLLFSGGVNRVAIQDSIEEFQKREGCIVNTVYNGCGILVGQMKTGQQPDAYFACDVSFMTQVADLFPDATDISQTDMVVAVARENPQTIRSIEDLARPGLKIGLANEQQSALGALTARLLKEMNLYDAITKNDGPRTPTADLLVNQLLVGSLDAAIVYEVNTSQARDKLQVIRIDHPAAHAIQPFAVGKHAKYPYLTQRLMQTIRSAPSRQRFESIGFRWLDQ
jgi:molybdenum ABC transporter molybdate-binding protein